jgi:hypothetical protein
MPTTRSPGSNSRGVIRPYSAVSAGLQQPDSPRSVRRVPRSLQVTADRHDILPPDPTPSSVNATDPFDVSPSTTEHKPWRVQLPGGWNGGPWTVREPAQKSAEVRSSQGAAYHSRAFDCKPPADYARPACTEKSTSRSLSNLLTTSTGHYSTRSPWVWGHGADNRISRPST